MARTLIILKPDCVERGLVGEVLARIERRGLRFGALERRVLPRALVEEHYAEHRGKPFYEGLVEYLTRGPVVVGVVEGSDDVVEIVRATMGATDPVKAAPGTLRGDLAVFIGENLIHGSDSPASAAREIRLFFPEFATG